MEIAIDATINRATLHFTIVFF